MSFVMVSHLDTCAHTPPTHTYTGAWVPSNHIQAYMPPPPQTSLPSFFNVQTCCWWCCPGNEFKAICYDDSCRSGVSVRGCMVDQDGAAAEILPICQMGGAHSLTQIMCQFSTNRFDEGGGCTPPTFGIQDKRLLIPLHYY